MQFNLNFQTVMRPYSTLRTCTRLLVTHLDTSSLLLPLSLLMPLMKVYRLCLAVLAIIVVRSSTPCYRAPLYIVLSLLHNVVMVAPLYPFASLPRLRGQGQLLRCAPLCSQFFIYLFTFLSFCQLFSRISVFKSHLNQPIENRVGLVQVQIHNNVKENLFQPAQNNSVQVQFSHKPNLNQLLPGGHIHRSAIMYPCVQFISHESMTRSTRLQHFTSYLCLTCCKDGDIVATCSFQPCLEDVSQTRHSQQDTDQSHSIKYISFRFAIL